MSYDFYKILHLAAVLAVFAALGGACLHAMNGGGQGKGGARTLVTALHGTGLLLALVAGFGLLARLDLFSGWPGWVWAKLAIWLVAGAYLTVPYRRPSLARPMLLALPFLGLAAAWLAIAKPF